MELVAASYDSDCSLDEDTSSKTLNKIDVIEIDDSDTDTDFKTPIKKEDANSKTSSPIEVQPSSSKEKKPNFAKEEKKEVSKVIECIDIDFNSDLEEDNKKSHGTSTDNLSVDTNKTECKKIDYLNLNSSDSEDEKTVLKEVKCLLDSSAITYDRPCGPENYNSKNEKFVNEVNSISNKSDLITNIPPLLKICETSQNDIKIKPDRNSFSNESYPNKRFKRESETPKSSASATNTELGEAEEPFIPSSLMYRKDERISTAFAKNLVCRLPRQITRHYINHVNVVTALHWCIPQYSHLLLSASVDCTAKIWDMYCRHPVQHFKDNLALKAAKWSLSGEQVIIGGYGKKARVFDVLSGKEIVSYDIFNYVSSLEVHPYMDDIFLCGTRNAIFGFDLRVNSGLPIRTYISKCEEILDIAFLDESEFISSTNVVSHDSADRTIMVWDFSSGAIMSNQIYLERYTCPSLKVHPHDSCFIAQTNGDYIAAFSSQKPYKIKNHRYMGHKVSGYGVECDISPDGKYIASGDANGDIFFYSYSSGNTVTKLTARSNVPTNRLKWHPALNSTIATATWDGHIQIWK